MFEECLKLPGVEVWSDASEGWGCGALWGDRWFQLEWSQYQDFMGASIVVKELLPIVVAAAIWGHLWMGKVVLCHCDNPAVVSAVCGGYCKDPSINGSDDAVPLLFGGQV